jgi:hypothetical protein
MPGGTGPDATLIPLDLAGLRGGLASILEAMSFDSVMRRCFNAGRLIQKTIQMLVSCPRNKHIFRCDQNGPPARRSEADWQLEGAYPEQATPLQRLEDHHLSS